MDEATRQRFERIEAILAQTAEQQAQNTVAITQLTHGIEQLRQSLVEERRLISDVRGELAQHAGNPDAHQGEDT